MSLSHEAMLELMQYADGELEGDARARVEALLRTSVEARGVVDAMGTLGDVVREGLDARAETSVAADRIADDVMKAIAATGAPAAGERSAEKAASVVSIARPRRSRGGVTSAVVAVLALAAGVAFFVTSKAPAPPPKEEVFAAAAPPPSELATPAPSSEPASEPAPIAQAESHGVDLEEVRSIRNKVNVFFTPVASSAGAATSVVVWIDDRNGGH